MERSRTPMRAMLAAMVLVVGCGADPQEVLDGATSPDAAHFVGLDAEVVGEAMANPIVVRRLAEEESKNVESMAQGIARNFEVCRDAFGVYSRWITTGDPGQLAPLPMPESPREPSYSGWIREYARFEAAASSGDPDQLRFQLTANGSCGQWIPARPGDVSGPTIAEVIEAGL